MPAILDLAICLVFVFLIFSLVVSALNEFWLTYLDRRSDFLQEDLRELLHDVDDGQWVGKICEHGLVDALSRDQGDKSPPACIGREPFTAAILDLISAAKPESVRIIEEVRNGIIGLGRANPKLKESLTVLLDEAAGDLSKFEDCVGKWYELSMDRVTGWYKRYAQRWLGRPPNHDFLLTKPPHVACESTKSTGVTLYRLKKMTDSNLNEGKP